MTHRLPSTRARADRDELPFGFSKSNAIELERECRFDRDKKVEEVGVRTEQYEGGLIQPVCPLNLPHLTVYALRARCQMPVGTEGGCLGRYRGDKPAASIRVFNRQVLINTGKSSLAASTEAGWQNPVYGSLLHIIAIIRAGYLWLISSMKIVTQQKHLDRQVKGVMAMPLITILSTVSTSSRGRGPDHNES